MSDIHLENPQISLLDISLSLPSAQKQRFKEAMLTWKEKGLIEKLWAGDASLWKGESDEHMIGWLKAPQDEPEKLSKGLAQLYQESNRWQHVVLLGMGGSALGAEALKAFLEHKKEAASLLVLDSLIPSDVEGVLAQIDPLKTLFVVSSKSGGTLESNTLFHYFWGKLDSLPEAERGTHFIAVTDPGTSLEALAQERGFSHIFHGHPKIGGRYSLFSAFGLVPLAASGYDLAPLLAGAVEMMNACAPKTPAEGNPGLVLGCALGSACLEGADKLIFEASDTLKAFGPWLEQLVAESTGKLGTGIFPVLPEGKKALKGADRIVAYTGLKAPKVAENASISLQPENVQQVGQMFYLWEFAIAVAGSVIAINPFDQPDVESSKKLSRALAKAYQETGKVPEVENFLKDGILSFASPEAALFAENKNAVEVFKAAFKSLKSGDYLGLLFWTGRESDAAGQKIAQLLQASLDVPVMLEMGPRFLHSTGQAYKGGKNTGLFLQLTCNKKNFSSEESKELAVLSATQEQGDYKALSESRRRVLRIEIEDNLIDGLKSLEKDIKKALDQL